MYKSVTVGENADLIFRVNTKSEGKNFSKKM
jgi:hypothetical protein